jgi:hypothetical protein
MRVLVIVASEREVNELQALVVPSHWHFHTAGFLTEALTIAQIETIPVLICNSNLHDGSWQDILGRLAEWRDPRA